MPILPFGKHYINTDRIVHVETPARRQHDDRTRPNQGVSDTAVAVVLAGSDDLNLFDADADAFREWLASQQPKAPVAPIVTKTTTPPTK